MVFVVEWELQNVVQSWPLRQESVFLKQRKSWNTQDLESKEVFVYLILKGQLCIN